MIFDEADKAIRTMNRENLKIFGKLKLAKWDSLTVIRDIAEAFDKSVQLAKKQYRRVARDAFIAALAAAHVTGRDRRAWAEESIDDDWILDMLEEVDPVTLYSFNAETERKKDRLIEAVSKAENRNAEIDKALRLWTRQIGQYADNSVSYAWIQALREAGVEEVVFHTQEDERVCDDCEPLDLTVYPIDDAPRLPLHWRCRCYYMPVTD